MQHDSSQSQRLRSFRTLPGFGLETVPPATQPSILAASKPRWLNGLWAPACKIWLIQFRPCSINLVLRGTRRLGTAACARMDCSTKQLLKVMFLLPPCLQHPHAGHCLQAEYVNSSHSSNSTVIYAANKRGITFDSESERKMQRGFFKVLFVECCALRSWEISCLNVYSCFCLV